MALVYNPSTRTTSDIEWVTTRIPGAPPVGNVKDVEYLDTGLLMDFTAYYALTAQKLVALGYKANVTLHGAPYDFRRAANEQQEYFTELRNLIQKNYETVRCFLVSNAIIFSKFKNNNTRVVLVAHSMGCTMSLYFLNQQTKAWKDKYIKSLVTLAGPWGGSAKSLEVVTVGTDLGFENIPIESEALKESIKFVERTQPSLAWMMPSSDIWPGDVLVKQEPNIEITTANLQRYFKAIGVPNMVPMYQDTQALLAGLPAPGVEVYYDGHRDNNDYLYRLSASMELVLIQQSRLFTPRIP